MTTDWDPKVHTPDRIHPEGWALIIMLCAVVGLAIYICVDTSG